MNSQDLPGLRKPSARRSKPDMAALIDQHSFVQSSRKHRSDHHKLLPYVSLEPLDSSDLDSPEPENTTERCVSPTTAVHFRPGRPKQQHPKRIRLIESAENGDIMEPLDGANGAGSPQKDSSSPSKRTSRHYLDGLIGRSSSSIHLESTVEKVCDREDEDDNDDDDLPLSSFVPTKPPPAVDTESKPLPPPAASTMATAPRYCPCSKPAVIDPRWDGQYCSVECLVRSCREAFGVWVDQKSDSGGAIRTNNIAV